MGFQKFRQPILTPFLRIANNVCFLSGNGAPTDATTGKGIAGPGSIYSDATNAVSYINVGTKASPTWRTIGSGAGQTKQVSNKSGSTITAGSLVYESGWDETNKLPTITLADADAGGKPAEFIVPADILTSTTGIVSTVLRSAASQNTNGASVGDPVYLSATPGGWTLSAPATANALVQIIGRVAVVSATVGVVAFDIEAEALKIGINELNFFPAQAIASGYKVARGVAAITGTGTVVTGLATVVAVIAIPASDPDGVGLAMVSATIGDQAGTPAAGSVILKAWKVTATNDATLIAASAAKNINWVAIGT